MSETCKSCGAPIFWAKTQSGKSVPIDQQEALDGNVTITESGVAKIVGIGEGRYVSHFATCKDATRWRRRS